MRNDLLRQTNDALAIVLGDVPADPHAFADEVVERFAAHVNPGILNARKSVTEAGDHVSVEWDGEGSLIRDVHGREFIDLLGGYGVYTLGIKHPDVMAAVHAQLARSPLHTQELLDPLRGSFAEVLAALAPAGLTRAFFCNSGAEAVEGAMKLAMWATGRHTFVAAENAFHGKTLGALSLMGKERFRSPFEPALIECARVPFGDAVALDALLDGADPKPAAVVLEPIQGEAGAVVPPDGYLAAVRAACDRHGVLLIADEVQTCLGRTGAMFAVDHWGVVPDIVTLGKGLGGGVLPIGAVLSTPAIWEVWEKDPFIHSNTFGGNPLACAAGIAAAHVTVRDDLPGRSLKVGERYAEAVRDLAAQYPGVLEGVTGRGLLQAMHFSTNELGYEVAAGLFRRNVLVAGTTANARAIRIEPALTIPDDLVDESLTRLADTLAEVAGRVRA
ncbi:MAG TPA: aminotransferase class III-fold pyridoxal phosphate-dependent enzyme [Acidimicrobiales bacterium]|nr:aminotransferase class III-fold pyridoxal phosphate-dependent enzyme [Acidimicrobiales bacterium]